MQMTMSDRLKHHCLSSDLKPILFGHQIKYRLYFERTKLCMFCIPYHVMTLSGSNAAVMVAVSYCSFGAWSGSEAAGRLCLKTVPDHSSLLKPSQTDSREEMARRVVSFDPFSSQVGSVELFSKCTLVSFQMCILLFFLLLASSL